MMRTITIAALAASALAGGCREQGYVQQKDSAGHVQAPAATRDMSETQRVPDSTTGVSRSTDRGTISGDTLGRSKEKQSAPVPPPPSPP